MHSDSIPSRSITGRHFALASDSVTRQKGLLRHNQQEPMSAPLGVRQGGRRIRRNNAMQAAMQAHRIKRESNFGLPTHARRLFGDFGDNYFVFNHHFPSRSKKVPSKTSPNRLLPYLAARQSGTDPPELFQLLLHAPRMLICSVISFAM